MTMPIVINKEQRDFLLANRGKMMKELQSATPQLKTAWGKSKKEPYTLYASFPQGLQTLVYDRFKLLLARAKGETIVIQVDDKVDLDKFRKRGIAPLEKELNRMIKEGGSDGPRTTSKGRLKEPVEIKVHKSQAQVRVTVDGSAFPLVSVILGRVQSTLLEYSEDGSVPLLSVQDNADEKGHKIFRNSNLTQLSTSRFLSPMPPQLTRLQALIRIAHFALWDLNMTVYGGFVRDMVIREEEPNDIDILMDRKGVTNVIANKLIAHATGVLKLRVKSPLHTKGAAKTVEFDAQGWQKGIEVDLVEPGVGKLPPYVDCDVGNICLKPRGVLGLKVLHTPRTSTPLIDLTTSISRCQARQFEAYYDPQEPSGEARKRVNKYLRRGWSQMPQLNQWWKL